MTLYDLIKQAHCGMDICDNTFDYSTYIDFTETESGEPSDGFSAAMIAIAKRLNVLVINTEHYTTCEIAEFLSEYGKEFKTFLLEENIYPFPEPKTIEEYYNEYIDLFDQLTKGSWPDKSYERFAELLEGHQEEQKLEKVTVPEILSKFGITQSTLAQRMEVSDGLISKIKNGASPITEEVQEKFQSVFKGYVLVNATYKAIDIIRQIQDLEKQSAKLDEDYAKAKQDIQNQRAILIGKLNEAAKEVSIKEDEE